MKITVKTTKAELIAHAATNLGAELSDSLTRDELVSEVKKLETSLGIVSENTEKKETKTIKTVKATTNEETKSKGRPEFVMLRIHTPPSSNADEEAEEETHCIVGFNGRNYQIAYDVEEGVKVPYGVYDILKNAVQSKYRKVKGQRELKETKEQRYKFNVVKEIF
jgi:hypothetical protein